QLHEAGDAQPAIIGERAVAGEADRRIEQIEQQRAEAAGWSGRAVFDKRRRALHKPSCHCGAAAPMPPDTPAPIFDRPLIARHLTRRSAGRDDFVTRLVLADLDERLGAVMRTFEKAVILSPDPAPLPARGESANGGFAFTRVSTVLDAPGVTRTDPEMLGLP